MLFSLFTLIHTTTPPPPHPVLLRQKWENILHCSHHERVLISPPYLCVSAYGNVLYGSRGNYAGCLKNNFGFSVRHTLCIIRFILHMLREYIYPYFLLTDKHIIFIILHISHCKLFQVRRNPTSEIIPRIRFICTQIFKKCVLQKL
jgi:hypothetical protein